MCWIARSRPRTTRGICGPGDDVEVAGVAHGAQPSDAAQLTASSNSSASAYSASATPSTTAMRERRDSSYWRTMSCPVLAVDFQWIWRRESPGAYSRIAWNDMSASTRRRVGLPSRSRMSPALVDGSAVVRGCT